MSNESIELAQSEPQKEIRYPIKTVAALLLIELWFLDWDVMNAIFQLNFIAHGAIFAAAFLSSRNLSIPQRNAWHAAVFYFATSLIIFYTMVFVVAVFGYSLPHNFIVGLLVFCVSVAIVLAKTKSGVADWRLFSVLIVIFTAVDKVSTLLDPTSDYSMIGIGTGPMLGIAAVLLFSAVLQYSIVIDMLRRTHLLPKGAPLFQSPLLDKGRAID